VLEPCPPARGRGVRLHDATPCERRLCAPQHLNECSNVQKTLTVLSCTWEVEGLSPTANKAEGRSQPIFSVYASRGTQPKTPLKRQQYVVCVSGLSVQVRGKLSVRRLHTQCSSSTNFAAGIRPAAQFCGARGLSTRALAVGGQGGRFTPNHAILTRPARQSRPQSCPSCSPIFRKLSWYLQLSPT